MPGKQLKYVGPHDEVVIPSLGLTCKRGESVEVHDVDAAENLADQQDWELVKPPKKKTTKQDEPSPDDNEGQGTA